MAYRFLNGWFVNDETKIAVKEPAIIVNLETWAILYFGEAKTIEKISQTINKDIDYTYIKFDRKKFSNEALVNILNDLLVNKKYIKFQLIKLLRNAVKEEQSSMSLEKNSLKESCCDGCFITAEEACESSDTLYACYGCDTVLCLDCYKAATDMDDSQEDAEIRCPECGELMYEITEDDIEKPSLDDMFG